MGIAKRHEMIDAHASFHLYQIQLEADAARNAIRRKAEFDARSAGQKKRRQMEGCKNAKHHAQ